MDAKEKSVAIFGISLFVSGIILMIMDMIFLTIPEYRSLIKWWHVGALLLSGIGLYIMPNNVLREHIEAAFGLAIKILKKLL